MKIIEALKEIPLIEKKIKKNNDDVLRYSATVDNGTPVLYFPTLEEQKTVASLVYTSNGYEILWLL